jgi:beta-1,4-N-acetylglucosaminyltransferase
MRLLLVASSGGHIYELFCLRNFWEGKERCWVSFPTADAKYLLRDEKEVYWAAYPTVRHVPNLLRNLVLALRILRRTRPDMVLTTGAGVAVPFLWLARAYRIPTVYVESITRLTDLSLSARLVRRFVTKLLVQWPELAQKYQGTEYHGRIL